MSDLSVRLYRLLLRLYPADFRREYGDLMTQLFRDRCRAAYRQHRRRGVALLWLSILPDLAVSLWVEYAEQWRRRSGMVNRMPRPAVWLLPGLVVTGLFFVEPNILSFYLWIGGIGLGGLALDRLGLIRAPAAVKLAGYGGLLMTLTLGAAVGIYLPGLGAGIWCLLLVRLRQIRQLRGEQGRLLALVFASAGVLAALRFFSRLDEYTALAALVQILFGLGWALMAAAPSLPGLLWPGRFGREMVLPTVLALGASYALYDPGYYTFEMWSLIAFGAVIFPFVLCPAWYLLAKGRRARQWGLLALWAAMLLGGTLLANYSRTVIQALPYETWLTNLESVALVVPYFFGLWLALAVYERGERTQDQAGAVSQRAPSTERMSPATGR